MLADPGSFAEVMTRQRLAMRRAMPGAWSLEPVLFAFYFLESPKSDPFLYCITNFRVTTPAAVRTAPM